MFSGVDQYHPTHQAFNCVISRSAWPRCHTHEQGWTTGDQIFHVGLRGACESVERMDWMFNNQTNYHFMPRFERNGFEETIEELIAEVKGR